MADRMDNLLDHLGTGKWHYLHFITILYSENFPSPHALGGAFLAPRQGHICDVPIDQNWHDPPSNDTELSCHYSVQNEDGSFQEEKCTKWIFDESTFTNTVTSEFELVCEKEYLRALYQSLYMLGVLVGSPINGLAADRFGRRTVYVTGAALFTIMAIGTCWVPNLFSLLLFRFLIGTMHPTILKSGYILAVEIAAPKVRSAIGVGFYFPWAIGTMVWALLAYYVRSWRWLQLYASLPCLLAMPALWFIDESPRWLSVRGEHKKAMDVIKKIARWNKKVLPSDEELMSIMKENQAKFPVKEKLEKVRSAKSSILGFINSAFILYRTPRLLLISMIMHLDFFVCGMVYFGLSLSGSSYKTDIFIYMALMGLMEVPGCSVMIPIVVRFGRKLPISVSFLLTGLVLLVLPFLPTEKAWLVITFAMIGKMTITMAFQSVNLFASELFPTEVRTRGISTSFMLSRVGSAISPFITEFLGPVYPWAPSVIFGSAGVVAGLATLLVWDTLGMALPDTITQLESKSFTIPKRSLTFRGINERRQNISKSEAGNQDEKMHLKDKLNNTP